MFLWCSGYHVRLTRGRSPVQSWVETILTIEYVIVIHIYFINSVSSNGDVAQMVERSLSM